MQHDVEEMSTLFSTLSAMFTDFESFLAKAHVIEKRADETAHQIVAALNTSFITPFDREDIHHLAHEMDEIIDRIEEIVRNVHLYHLTSRVDSMKEFADCIQRATGHLAVMLGQLEHKKYTQGLTDEKIQIHEIEDEADVLFEQAMQRLFANTPDPLQVIKIKDMLEQMEMVVDKYRHVANLIESILIKVS
jgi:hypothetical protein